MSSENFCLKWNDHHSVFFTNVESLCEKSFLTDVVLSAGGSLFQAHKLVLSICSTYFQVCSQLFSSPHLIIIDRISSPSRCPGLPRILSYT